MPNSLPWMESVDAKMIRAHENIEGIRREIDAWFASINLNIYLKSAPDAPRPWLVVHASDYIPPVRFSVLIGECVHNMRSAVDNLICGLARTKKPTSKCGGLAFPLVSKPDEWEEIADRVLKGIPPAAREIIRQLQPWPGTPERNPLTILNKLSNLDKHRACNFTLPYHENAAFRIHSASGAVIEIKADKRLYFGDVHPIPLQIDKRLVEGQVRVESFGTFVLTFQEESAWDDVHVVQVLRDCFDHIERNVIGHLKPFFAPEGQ